MKFSIRQTKDIELIKRLHNESFPKDEFEKEEKTTYWIALDNRNTPCGFASAKELSNNICYLTWAGVNYKYRGHGLHKKLISVRVRFAKRRGCTHVITYTSRENHYSANNLMDFGFRAYAPENPWVGPNYNYWIKNIYLP